MTSSPSDQPRRTFVVASTGDALFCLDVARVREVVPVGRVTRVPGADPAILGVLNVRGRVLALADLSASLGGDRCVGADESGAAYGAAVVLELDMSREIAVAVHAVIDVVELPSEALQPPPTFGLGGAAPFTEAVVPLPDGLAVVLDVEALFGGTETSVETPMATGDGS